MIQRLQRKGPFALAAFIGLTAVLQQFLTVYHFEDKSTAVLVTGAVCLSLALLPKGGLRLPAVLLLFTFGVYRYFPLGQSVGLDWLAAIWRQLRPLINLVQSEGFGRTPSLLAFSLIMAALVLLSVLMIEYEHFLFSYLTMLAYLLILVVFNHLEPLLQIFLVAACGLFSYGLKQNRRRGLSHEGSYILVAVLLLFLMAGIAQYLPDTFLRDPLAKQTVAVRNYFNDVGLYNYIESIGVGSNTRTGFSEDDEALGGAMVDDDTLLFTAQQLRPHYWRVDSKDNYTGKGWQRQQSEESSVLLENRFTVQASDAPLLKYPQQQRINLEFMTRNTYLPLPYGNTTIGLVSGFLGFEYAQLNQRVDLILEEAEKQQVYLDTQEPDYSVDSLRGVLLELPPTESDYLQLPEELPKRIQSLAEQVTKEQRTLYEKVTAVETYLSTSKDFRYSKVDAVAPLPDQDYVDQFLFETRVGYCDNFSSAMVVMLRTLGIPARWAKGFSQGEARPSFEEQKVYEIKNLNAHSWPEVYFAGYGWVPFEPTPSFINPDRPGTALAEEGTQTTQMTTDSSLTAQSSQTSETAESTSATTTESQKQPTTSAGEKADSKENSNSSWGYKTVLLIAGGLAAVALIFLVWHRRLKFVLFVISKCSKQPFSTGYLYLLKEWEKLLSRQPSENLKEYGRRLTETYPQQTTKFIALTEDYEAHLYNKQQPLENSGSLFQTAAQELRQAQKATAEKQRSIRKNC